MKVFCGWGVEIAFVGGAGVEGEEIDSAYDGRVRGDVLNVGVWGYTVFLIDRLLEGSPV